MIGYYKISVCDCGQKIINVYSSKGDYGIRSKIDATEENFHAIKPNEENLGSHNIIDFTIEDHEDLKLRLNLFSPKTSISCYKLLFTEQ